MASTELFLLPCFLLFFSPLPASRVSCEMKTIRHIDLKGAQLTFPSLCIFGGARAGLARLRPGPGVDLTAGLLLVKKIKLWRQLSVYLLGDKFSLSWEGIEYTVLLPLFLPMCPLGVTQEWGEELSTDTIPWRPCPLIFPSMSFTWPRHALVHGLWLPLSKASFLKCSFK